MRSVETVLAWPAMLVPDDDGRVQVRFPDFPGALTDGADEREALVEAADCLAEAVAARIADGEDIPAPAPLRRGMYAVPLPPVLAYKAALFSAMRRDGISKSELARRLGVDEKDVRRLVDPRYRGSRIERLHAALTACGIVAQITLVDSASRERLLGSAKKPSEDNPAGRGHRDAPGGVANRRACSCAAIGPTRQSSASGVIGQTASIATTPAPPILVDRRRRRSRNSSGAAAMSSTGATKPEAERIIDRVQEAGYESFPSSDPPSWTPTRAGRPAPSSGDRPKSKQKTVRSRRPVSGRTAG